MADAPLQIGGTVDKTLRGNIRYLCLSLIMGTIICQSGFDNSVVGGFQAMVGFLKVFGYEDPTSSTGWNIGTVPQQIISSFMTLGSAIGALAVGPLSTWLSRRWIMALGCVSLIIGAIVQITTKHLGALYFGRIMTGVANGFIQASCVMYIQETAPPHLRSLASGILQSFLSIGSLLGTIVNNETADISSRLCYQIPLFILLAFPVIFLAIIPFLPESPRWLLLRGHEEAAMTHLHRLRKGPYDLHAIESEFESMRSSRQAEIESESIVSFLELFRGTNRRRTLLSWGVAICPSGVGAMFFLMYAVYFFQMAGVGKSFEDTVIVQCLGLVGIYASFFVISKMGSKRVLILSACICCVCMLISGAVYTGTNGSKAGIKVVVAMTALYMFGFNCGIAVYSFPVAAELPSQRLRSYTMGSSVSISFFFSWLITFTAPYFINSANLNWGPKYCFIWFGSSLAVIFFLLFFLPDVSGRTLEEIDMLFAAKVPASQFHKHALANAHGKPGTDNAAAEHQEFA